MARSALYIAHHTTGTMTLRYILHTIPLATDATDPPMLGIQGKVAEVCD